MTLIRHAIHRPIELKESTTMQRQRLSYATAATPVDPADAIAKCCDALGLPSTAKPEEITAALAAALAAIGAAAPVAGDPAAVAAGRRAAFKAASVKGRRVAR